MIPANKMFYEIMRGEAFRALMRVPEFGALPVVERELVGPFGVRPFFFFVPRIYSY